MRWGELSAEGEVKDAMYSDFVTLRHCGGQERFDLLYPFYVSYWTERAKHLKVDDEKKTKAENTLRKKDGLGVELVLHHLDEQYVQNQPTSRWFTGLAPLSSITATQAGQEKANATKKANQNWDKLGIHAGIMALRRYQTAESERSAPDGDRPVTFKRDIDKESAFNKRAWWVFKKNEAHLFKAFEGEEPEVVCVRLDTEREITDADLTSATTRWMKWDNWPKYRGDMAAFAYITPDERPGSQGT